VRSQPFRARRLRQVGSLRELSAPTLDPSRLANSCASPNNALHRTRAAASLGHPLVIPPPPPARGRAPVSFWPLGGQSIVTARRLTRPVAVMASVVVLGCRHADLTLEILEPNEREERVVAKNPDSAVIKNTVESLKWSGITFVILKRDSKNWIEGSGSLRPEDGLSARYSEDGVEHVSARAPVSLAEIVDLLQSYRSGDGRWRTMMEWH
jgi:hypothetical protein